LKKGRLIFAGIMVLAFVSVLSNSLFAVMLPEKNKGYIFKRIPEVEKSTATITLLPDRTYQTIEGFGASVAWYEISLARHPNGEDIYYDIFHKLGLSILRLRNGYRYQAAENFSPDLANVVKNMYIYSDRSPKIMMSLWSPPINLKSNNFHVGGTLKKNESGEFMYDEFAQYWLDSLEAYKKMGIVPDYISIQNEPSWGEWESCLFRETETADTAGYNKALDAVYNKLQSMDSPPKILAPEEHGIGYNAMQKFVGALNRNLIYGYAYHLYHGEESNINNPDAFNENLESVAELCSDKPIFQTEFDRGDWFYTAWLMHNTLVNGNASAYFYWALVWGYGGKALVLLEDINNPSVWTTPEGYILTPAYYAFRQYSKYIYPGWKRISTQTDSDDVRVSAFINPAKDKITAVILNVSPKALNILINDIGLELAGVDVIRTSENEQGRYIGKYEPDTYLELPGWSITTLLFDVDTE
jgi:glucuronoarabinoxylan endo-1,4-beta-xylanase